MDGVCRSNKKVLGLKRRHAVVLACSGAMFIAYIDRVSISVAALAMQAEFGWSEAVKGYVLSTFFVGYIVTQLVGGWLAHRFGGREVMLVALVAWSVFTVLTPIAAYVSFAWLIVFRILLGVGEGPLHPAAYLIIGNWVRESERTTAIAFYGSFGFAGTFAALATTGLIVDAFGWPAVFYIFGVAGLAYTWLIRHLVQNRPIYSKSAETSEPQKISRPGSAESIPWRKLLTIGPFWILAFTFFCTSWIYYVLLLWMPSYYAAEFGVSTASAGIFSLAPFVIMFITMNFAGWGADRLLEAGVSLTTIRKSFAGVGLGGAGVLLVSIGLVKSEFVALLFFCCVLGSLGIAYSSHSPNVFDLAPRFAHLLLGVLLTFGSLPGLIGVTVTGVIVNATNSYDQALTIAGLLALAGALVYVLGGTGRKVVD